MKSVHNPQFDQLLAKLCDEQLTSADELQLGEFLRRHEYRERYLALMHLQVTLSLWQGRLPSVDNFALAAGAADASRADRANHGRRTSAVSLWRRFFRRPQPLSLTAATIFIGALLLVLSLMAAPIYRAVARRPAVAPAPLFVAQITGERGARWKDTPLSMMPHSHLLAGQRFELTAGVAELTFRSGAVIVLEAPCRFTLVAPGAMQIDEGRLVARVPPPAIGFVVDTPVVSLVDLGTEFGVQATKTNTEAHVFKGRVQAIYGTNTAKTRTIELSAGQAASFSATGKAIARGPATAENFFRDRLSQGQLLAHLSRDYRAVNIGLTTGGVDNGPGLPGLVSGHWNYYRSGTQNPNGALSRLTHLIYGLGGEPKVTCYFGGQGTYRVPAVSNAQIFAGNRPPPREGELAVHPSDKGDEFVVVRWTPDNQFHGKVEIHGSARVLSKMAPQPKYDGVTVALYGAGTELLNTHLALGDQQGVRFAHTVELSPGDSIDFVVGRNGTFFHDEVGLSISIFEFAAPLQQAGDEERSPLRGE